MILVTVFQFGNPAEKSSAKTAAVTVIGAEATWFPSFPASSTAST